MTCLNKCAILYLFKQVGVEEVAIMAKYTEEVKQLLDLIGGKENIAAVSHCMTRMRFVLVDEKKANAKEIEKSNA